MVMELLLPPLRNDPKLLHTTRAAAERFPAPEKLEIRVCVNRACSRQGSRDALSVLSGIAPPSVSVVSCGCLGRCGAGPNLDVLPSEVLVGHCGTPARAAEVLAEVLQSGFDPRRSLEALSLRKKGEAELAENEDAAEAEAIFSKVNTRKSISMQAGTRQPPNSPIAHGIVQLIASLLVLQLPLPAHALEQMYSIPKIELESNFQSVILADLDPVTAKALISITGPFLSGFGFLFILRIVMSWYPKLPVDKFPYVIAYAPTEPILRVTRKLITPVGGVDVTPVVWFGLLSFLNEILVGPQGLLVLLSQKV